MKIGWIGAGQMGVPMAGNLLKAGHDVAVFDVNPDGVAALVARGASAADTIADACDGADAVISSIPDDKVLRAVALDAEGVLASMDGGIYVEMSTVSPGVSEDVSAVAQERGIAYLRAPVSGSVGFAEAGTLTVIVSGPADAFETCRPLFDVFGSKVFHVGAAEQARYLKLIINNMVHATAVALAESLAVGRKGGLDWKQMLEVIASSAVASPLVLYKAGVLGDRDFTPASYVRTAVKDQGLFVDAAADNGVPLDIGEVIAAVFRDMEESDVNDKDFFATVLRTERAAGLEDV